MQLPKWGPTVPNDLEPRALSPDSCHFLIYPLLGSAGIGQLSGGGGSTS